MSLAQRVFSALFGPGVERESREWLIECPKCGYEDTVWDRGGVRYKASGTKHILSRCRNCGESARLKVHRKA